MAMFVLILAMACSSGDDSGDASDGGASDTGASDGGGVEHLEEGPGVDADGQHFGPEVAMRCGSHLAAAGDVDGDGTAEVWVGCAGTVPDPESLPSYEAPASIERLSGPGTGTGGLDTPSARLLLPETSLAMASADLDGDGILDLLAGNPYADTTVPESGLALMVQGPVSGEHGASSADLRIEGQRPSQELGETVGIGTDLSGDGVAELLMSHVQASGDRSVAVIEGTTRYTTWPDDWPQLLPSEAGGWRPSASSDRADLDGDGLDDLVLEGTGALSILPADTRITDDVAIDEVALAVRGPDRDNGLRALPADLDGDGHVDLVVACPLDSSGEDLGEAGRVWALAGPFTGDRAVLDDAFFFVEGDAAYANLGVALDAGDLDHDGRDDLVLATAASLENGRGPGRVLLFSAPLSGNRILEDANQTWTGHTSEGFGASVLVTDLDGDHQDDLVVGAPASNERVHAGGVVYVLLGSSL